MFCCRGCLGPAGRLWCALTVLARMNVCYCLLPSLRREADGLNETLEARLTGLLG
jgi:hypothetical protein